jgi:hypothetical protein
MSTSSSILDELWMVGNAGGSPDRALDLVCVFNLGGGVGVDNDDGNDDDDDDDEDGNDDDDDAGDERSPLASAS